MNTLSATLLTTLITSSMLSSLPAHATENPATAPWVADLGNGEYQNPILHADYSDPDVVRVGEDYYMTASSFTNTPGLPILHSYDLVNWELIGHALPRQVPDAHHATPRRGGGVWAPSIRHHDGKFMIYYPDPDFGVYLVTATDPAGPWSAPVLVDNTPGVIDPAPFWDDDGQAYLVMAFAKSRAGFANVLRIKPLNAEGTHTQGEGKIVVNGEALPPAETSTGPRPWVTIEGPKLYKRNGYYYIFAPAGSVKPGWQGVFRSRNIWGPYEGRNVMDQGQSATNGPHQGAWVDTVTGEDWFIHFQDKDSYGRIVHLQPMHWQDDWPVIGADPKHTGRGEPVAHYRKPDVSADYPIRVPQMNDEFEGSLSLAWQWHANPQDDWASLSATPGKLRLKAASAPANLYEAGNLLTQKLPAPAFTATTLLTFNPKAEGEQAGLVMFGYDYAWIGLVKTAKGIRLVQRTRINAIGNQPEREVAGQALETSTVYLRLQAEPTKVTVTPPASSTKPWASESQATHAKLSFAYSLDGEHFTSFGESFISKPGRWVGTQFGLFCSAPSGTPAYVATSVGYADFDWFHVTR
ncbi:glycoside hydrolase family 43 protein [Uliginosibacterium gangwonense]|uniref:glycoside hydrolase family 43 protein n=1 Tax=Uliginosibacterium gangwonense TaxID=392736 RepID=UPI0005261FC8|nr:glycoside hydrolase 43 family protein [Uliginosibacterium gangwonense]